MKEIKISQGKIALVDDEDYDYLNQFKWYSHKADNKWYAIRSVYIKEIRDCKMIYMHRELMNYPALKVDHIDHDGLNNQKANLRIATDSQNSANTTSRKNSSSKFIGVYYRPTKRKKWAACIRKHGKTKYIGSFDKQEDAALAYNTIAIQYFGEFASLNKITA